MHASIPYPLPDAQKVRFLELVDASNGIDSCHIWRGRIREFGYGMFDFSNMSRRAHRVSWVIHNGEIPNDLHVLHRCDNPPCCNPRHLWLGTDADNVNDRIAKGRTSADHSNRERGNYHHSRRRPEGLARGVINGQAKLKEHEVYEIRRLSINGRSHTTISRMFGVCRSNVRLIVNRLTWRHLP